MAKAKLYKFKKDQHTMKELATHFKLSYCRMSNLMHKFNHDADVIWLQRNSTDGAKRSGKNPKSHVVNDISPQVTMTVEEIAQKTGYSKAAISGKVKRGIIGPALLQKKNHKPLYAIKLKPDGSTVTVLPNGAAGLTVKADKNRLIIAKANKENQQTRKKWAEAALGEIQTTEALPVTQMQQPIGMQLRGVADTGNRAQLKNAISDYLAAGGTIQRLQADGKAEGNSWKDQAKRTYAAGPGRKKKRKLQTRKLPETIVVDESGTRKGGSVDVAAFIAELEKERDQRKAYGEVLHLAGDVEIEELESLLPKTVA
jgi:hypothetical protein